MAIPYYSAGFGLGALKPAAPVSSPFNLNPPPQAGQGTFGMVPGPIGLPNPAGDLGTQYPNLGKTNATLSSDILAQLGGKLSPGTLRQMQDYEAGFAAQSGMPGSNAIPGTLNYNRGVRDIGTTAEAQIRAGEQALNPALSTISATQTVSPALQTEIAGTNALNASAPNPGMAQNYAQQLFDQYMQRMRGPGGGTSPMGSPAGGGMPSSLPDRYTTGTYTSPPGSGGPPPMDSTMYPGTNLNGAPSLDWLLGPADPNYGQDQFGGAPSTDTSNYDPFSAIDFGGDY